MLDKIYSSVFLTIHVEVLAKKKEFEHLFKKPEICDGPFQRQAMYALGVSACGFSLARLKPLS